MSAVADGDLAYRLSIPKNRSDEFGKLALSFEAMTRQLSELDKLKAEFVSVASHELKTRSRHHRISAAARRRGVWIADPETSRDPSDDRGAGQHAVPPRQAIARCQPVRGRRRSIGAAPIKLDQLIADLESSFHVLAVQRDVNFCVSGADGLPNEVVWDLDRINDGTR